MICNKIDKLGEHPVGLERDERAPGASLAVSPDREGCEYLFRP
jgi:GTP-binding protein HflX